MNNLSKFADILYNYLENIFDNRFINFKIKYYDYYINIEINYYLGSFVFGYYFTDNELMNLTNSIPIINRLVGALCKALTDDFYKHIIKDWNKLEYKMMNG